MHNLPTLVSERETVQGRPKRENVWVVRLQCRITVTHEDVGVKYRPFDLAQGRL